MKDPRRNPDRVLAALAEYLRLWPGQRVGQAIVNHLPARYRNDAFFIEDDDLAAAIERSLSVMAGGDDASREGGR